jgi:hypothetical protein
MEALQCMRIAYAAEPDRGLHATLHALMTNSARTFTASRLDERHKSSDPAVRKNFPHKKRLVLRVHWMMSTWAINVI